MAFYWFSGLGQRTVRAIELWAFAVSVGIRKRKSPPGLTNRQTLNWVDLGIKLADRSLCAIRFSSPYRDLLEPTEVPRLSIIVPHLHDDSGLELTLLSILENREKDYEVLIAHDGRYSDPYGLDQDEVILIQSETNASLTEQLNLAIAAACSPVVEVLLPGATVQTHWCDEGLDMLSDRRISAVCMPVVDTATGEIYFGLSNDSLPHRRVAHSEKNLGGPLLCGGLFRKRTLRNIDGWMHSSSREIAEVEFSLLATAMELEMVVAENATIHAPKRVAVGQEAGYEIGRACGQLACAYASIEGTGVVIDSVAKRLGHLASGLMSPKTVAERLGWVMGIRDRSLVRTIQTRLESAAAAISEQAGAIPRTNAGSIEQRRAA